MTLAGWHDAQASGRAVEIRARAGDRYRTVEDIDEDGTIVLMKGLGMMRRVGRLQHLESAA
jgi:hypothetical protein